MKKSSVLSLIVLWIVPLLTSTAYPQNSKHPPLTVKIPFEFVVGHQTFPAGTYQFRSLLNSIPSQASIDVLEVRGTVERLYSAIVTDVVGSAEPSQPRIVFTRIGDRALLSEVWEAGKLAGCRLLSHHDRTQTEESENDRVTLVASADSR